VDTQCANGQWNYGETIDLPSKFQPAPGALKIGTGIDGKVEELPGQIEIQKRKSGPASGDNSNSQYAALGIRACLSALVVIPKETIELAERWWEGSGNGDGGWPYSGPDDKLRPTRGSMTVGAIGALAIYKYYRKRVWGESVDIMGSASVQRGISWLATNLAFNGQNPGHPRDPAGVRWHMYYWYGVERAGRLLDVEKFGSKEWYPMGANHLLSIQKPDGNWDEGWEGWGESEGSLSVVSTCFAILFLRRATPKLDDTIIRTGQHFPDGTKDPK